jgi:protein-L-isoaspartate(D-aspartate) O-methyltransferase
MDFTAQRRDLIEHIRERGIADERVLAAIGEVPREDFVPEALHQHAYEDRALPIGLDQTISQPFTVASMCEALQLAGTETVLEIGTGSGYGACVLSRLAAWIHTVERLPDLADSARERIARLGFRNVSVHLGDGSLGWPDAAPFDAIIATAGGEHCPAAYFEQLAEGGRIVIPIGPTPRRQTLTRYTRLDGQVRVEPLGEYAFVPLIGADAWEEPSQNEE